MAWRPRGAEALPKVDTGGTVAKPSTIMLLTGYVLQRSREGVTALVVGVAPRSLLPQTTSARYWGKGGRGSQTPTSEGHAL